MEDIQLSPHFLLSEFCNNWRGGEIEQRNWEIGSSSPYIDNMKLLCTSILEPLRKRYMSSVKIASGFRFAEQKEDGTWWGLDVAIRTPRQQKGYDNRSQHTRGSAADIHVDGIKDRDVFEWLAYHCPSPFGQVIYEVSGRSVWVHISIPGWRIPLTGGGLIYGEVMDAYQDSLGRWCYKKIAQIDPWKQREVWLARTAR